MGNLGRIFGHWHLRSPGVQQLEFVWRRREDDAAMICHDLIERKITLSEFRFLRQSDLFNADAPSLHPYLLRTGIGIDCECILSVYHSHLLARQNLVSVRIPRA